MPRTTGFLISTLLLASFCGSLAVAQEAVPRYPRLTEISFNPKIESIWGLRLHEVRDWFDPREQIDEYLDGMSVGSNGLMNERLTYYLEMDFWPVKIDGFQYTEEQYLAQEWHQPDGVDYQIILRDYNLARKCDRGELDEVAIQGAPYFGYWESNMAGHGGYWCNSSPQQKVACSKIFIVMGWNYERQVSLHATGHRVESIMSHVYNGWDVNGDRTIWDRFGWNIGQTTISDVYGVGSAHLPANGDDHYDYANPQWVESYAPQWANFTGNETGLFPDPAGDTMMVSRTTWGSQPNSFEMAYFIWWYQHMPHVDGRNQLDGYNRLNNWWEYLWNFNEYPESGGEHDLGGPAPDAAPYDWAPTRLTENTVDEWCPIANANDRVVWYGWDGQDFEIFSANVDGSDLVQITDNDYEDEAVEINANGQLVWQSFDGQDFEIFTANADGSNLTQVTDNIENDWHPDISDTGRIVWDFWDGEDYEVRSANADGSDLVQITNNSHGGGVDQRFDDCWPRINASNRVVWFGYEGVDFEIYSANADGTDLVQLSNNSLKDEFPQISNSGTVVWHCWHSNENTEVYAANANGGGVVQLTSSAFNKDWWPQVNDLDQVVWMSRHSTGWEVCRINADGSEFTQITDNLQHDQYPQIDNDGRIVWQGFDGEDWEIYAYVDGAIYQYSDNDYHDRWPHIGGERYVVWHGEADPGTAGRTTEIFSIPPELDLTPPALADTYTSPLYPEEVRLTFSEPVEETSAETASNYALSGGVAVLAAALEADQQTVVLTTTSMTLDVTYTLTVNNVTDIAEPPNTIPTDSQISFTFGTWQRILAQPLVQYDFTAGAGDTVLDVSGRDEPLDLSIDDLGAATWSDDGLTLNSATHLYTTNPANRVGDACVASGEVSIEAWITPASATQGGPARIVTYSNSIWARNFTLGQGLSDGTAADAFDLRLRTSDTDINGLPSTTTPTGTVTTDPLHVIAVREATGELRIYVNDVDVLSGAGGVDGTFDNWNTGYKIVLGNELSNDTPWLGTFHLVAIYGFALSPDQVHQNFMAGDGSGPEIVPGDLNCDGSVDFDDISPFVLALGGQAGYEVAYPDCNYWNADCNGDGAVDFDDINSFIGLIGG